MAYKNISNPQLNYMKIKLFWKLLTNILTSSSYKLFMQYKRSLDCVFYIDMVHDTMIQ